MIPRILRLLLCAVRHPSWVREYEQRGVTCFTCSPVRKGVRKSDRQMTLQELDREAEAQTQLAEGYRNPPEA